VIWPPRSKKFTGVIAYRNSRERGSFSMLSIAPSPATRCFVPLAVGRYNGLNLRWASATQLRYSDGFSFGCSHVFIHCMNHPFEMHTAGAPLFGSRSSTTRHEILHVAGARACGPECQPLTMQQFISVLYMAASPTTVAMRQHWSLVSVGSRGSSFSRPMARFLENLKVK